MKKILCLIFTFILVYGIILTSCSNNEQSNGSVEGYSEKESTENTEDTDTSGIPEPELPNMNYNGDDFTFIIHARDAHAYREFYVFTETMDGEVVNDAVYTRNLNVEERFNIKINVMEYDDSAATIRKLILAGDNVFDAIYESKMFMGKLGYEGLLTDLKTLPYIDFKADYWEANAYEQLQIADKLYVIPSDISMQNLSGARLLYFNKKILTDYSLTSPYIYVMDNTWTLDNFIKMVGSVSSDLNGDGVMDKEDLFGMLTEKGDANGNVLYFTISSGIRFTTSKPDGIEISYMTDKTQGVIDKIRDVLNNPEYCIDYITVTQGVDTSAFAHLFTYSRTVLFGNDHFLFVQNGINETAEFINMKSDYGIAPNPKYDEQQENYHHKLDVYNTILSVPILNTDLEKTGMILEYMAYMSNKLVVPAYYETTIQNKRVRDTESIDIINIVKKSLYYDVTDLFMDMLSVRPSMVIANAFTNGNLASENAKSEESMKTKLDDIYNKIKDNP